MNNCNQLSIPFVSKLMSLIKKERPVSDKHMEIEFIFTPFTMCEVKTDEEVQNVLNEYNDYIAYVADDYKKKDTKSYFHSAYFEKENKIRFVYNFIPFTFCEGEKYSTEELVRQYANLIITQFEHYTARNSVVRFRGDVF